jgi:hypothetical protein
MDEFMATHTPQIQKRKRAHSKTATEPTPKRTNGTPPWTPPPFTIHTTHFLRDSENQSPPPLPSPCTEALQRKKTHLDPSPTCTDEQLPPCHTDQEIESLTPIVNTPKTGNEKPTSYTTIPQIEPKDTDMMARLLALTSKEN